MRIAKPAGTLIRLAASSVGGREDELGLAGDEPDIGAGAFVGARVFIGGATEGASFVGGTSAVAPGAAHAARNMSAQTLDANLMFILYPALCHFEGSQRRP